MVVIGQSVRQVEISFPLLAIQLLPDFLGFFRSLGIVSGRHLVRGQCRQFSAIGVPTAARSWVVSGAGVPRFKDGVARSMPTLGKRRRIKYSMRAKGVRFSDMARLSLSRSA
jgi:hypothetical protein